MRTVVSVDTRNSHVSFVLYVCMFVCLFVFRLRCLLRQLQKGEISAELLQKNLRYAAKVLEAVFIDEAK